MKKITFTNSRSESIEFYRRPFMIKKIEGLGEVDAEAHTTKSPYMDGVIYLDSTLEPRDLSIEGVITVGGAKEILNQRRTLQRVLNPKLGLGELKIEEEGTVKIADCYSDGTPAFPDKERSNRQKFNMTLTCPDPFFKDLNQVSRALRAYEGKFTLPFTLPFRLGKQGDRTTLTNEGDVPAPVQIDLQGPVTNPKITNETTGEFIQIKGSVAADEVLHIDTAPNRKRAEIYNGDNFVREMYGRIAYEQGAWFWQLEIGANDVSYVADEGNNKAIVAVSWRNMYAGI